MSRQKSAVSLILLLTLIATGITLPAAASAQKKNATALPAPSGKLLRNVPPLTVDSLPNGLRILFSRVSNIPLSEINIIVDAGIGREAKDESGAAWALGQLLLSGSRNRTGDMVGNYLTELGSVVVPYAHYDYAQLYGRTLSKNFSGTLSVMADAAVSPTLPEQSLLALKQNASTRLQRVVSSGERATVAAVRSICGDEHVLSRYLQPTAEQVAALGLEQIKAFHATWYKPSGTTVIVTGDLDYAFVRTAIIEAFGKWENRDSRPQLRATITARLPDPYAGQAVLLLPDSDTPKGLAYFRFGVRAPLRGDADFAATILLNSIVSDGPQSRLRRKFWIDRVISPNFTAALAFSRDCSYFIISGSATPALADSVLVYMQEAVLEIARDGVTGEELSTAKAALLANEALSFGSNRNLQGLLKESTVYGIPYEQMVAFTEHVRSVSVEDIRRVAGALFQPEKWSTVTLGDPEKLAPVLTASGRSVRTIE